MMGYELVTLATIRQNTFATLYTLINTNKPNGWNVFSSYPEDNASFPCIILNSANIKLTIITMDGSGQVVDDIDFKVEFYAKASQGDDQIEVGRDNVQNTLISNQSTLRTYGLELKEKPFDDSNVDVFISGKQKIRTAASMVGLMLK